jgi:hypothetical protein
MLILGSLLFFTSPALHIRCFALNEGTVLGDKRFPRETFQT